MVMEIVHSAIARKMLCQPVNNLIAPTELVCSVGVMARRLGLSEEEAEQIAELSDTREVQQEMIAIFSKQDLTEFEESFQNLAEMIREYRGDAVPFLEEYRELFRYSYKNPLRFPKMNR
ncbi:MAG: DUF3837 family protein [Lachnospiraceae bacterium]|mgnify:CR=1 FL=1|nr:DUF3837 family protein [Lachnospiraceae bacterium]